MVGPEEVHWASRRVLSFCMGAHLCTCSRAQQPRSANSACQNVKRGRHVVRLGPDKPAVKLVVPFSAILFWWQQLTSNHP